ncbi:PTS sugar transporter subunit IIA [Clostridium sp. AL.422]|uniref:PTS sugar transporter subunit IIA n=1 Tax=Clostridium TaxID=1485 RepID=UPI00293DAB9B|nr:MULTISPECIES: PTS sugar transporter subunit IIA [unclassified Clostridium]MDV4149894.1 PTS sugar transporter subunit IIA [Clostridium sp. AL.422]
MVGVILITHGDMAEGIKTAVDLILGEQEQFKAIGLYEGADFEVFKEKVGEAIENVNNGNGVIALVDLFGASPYNSVAYNIMKFNERDIPIRIVSGVNLPMMIEVLLARESANTPNELYPIALSAGKDGIKEALEELGL